jgi:hypothetical protein
MNRGAALQSGDDSFISPYARLAKLTQPYRSWTDGDKCLNSEYSRELQRKMEAKT